MISLKKRLMLTYALFTGLSLAVLTCIINLSIGAMFSRLIKSNIRERSGEIIATIAEQYDPLSAGFDTAALGALGMCFVHEGYIVRIEDALGAVIWDARDADMLHCAAVMDEIAGRMEHNYRLKGTVEDRRYPLPYGKETIGAVKIETYGPFFYSETEMGFLASINRVLFAAGLSFIVLSAAVSFFLASAISRPIVLAGQAARRIAGEHAGGGRGTGKTARIRDDYKTRELRDLSRSINELAEELDEGERRQRQLSADVAHELRTPLSCLQGTMEAMIDGVWEPTARRLASCHEEILRLSKLVEDLNLLTSLEWENLALDKTNFDLAELLDLTAEQFRPAAGEKGIALEKDLAPCPVYGDYNRLKQVFVNILSNAVRYTDRGSVTVRVRPAGEGADKGFLEVTAADTGQGIGKGEEDRIFERFYRSDLSRSRNTGGAGIGLTIAAAIVKAHGGRIGAESRAEGGTLFRVELPAGGGKNTENPKNN
ncbi:MAG: two-component sensor histidine kinase [Treponema sp.]|jgi:signal transduction histidine kinase|nr:two-component sensor histidine kinase [Treponema sp.]